MSCPFNEDSLEKLKSFIDFCRQKPSIIHSPPLAFFKSYLESIGASLPLREPMDPTPPPPKAQAEPEAEAADEAVESDADSDLEFDLEGCIEPDADDPAQVMGDPDKVPTEEDVDKAEETRMGAMSELSQGNIAEAVALFSQAIELNPSSAVLYVKRGQAYLKLKKPNACIKDCTQALVVNPDSAAGYKFRGHAYQLIADWDNAAKDLRQACIIDFDEDIEEWLKQVSPNAQKIEQRRLKQERKQTEKEQKERAERVRKAKEAHAKAAEAATPQGAEAGGTEGFGGAGMGDFYKLLQDPEVMAAFKDPEVAAAFQDISMNPTNFVKYQSNPKIMALISKLSNKFQGSGMGFPGGLGGFPGFPGAGGFGAGAPGKPSEDDGLD